MRLSIGPGILEVVAEREATAAALLDAIHGTVGFIEELLRVAAVCRVETDTNAGADCAVTAFDAERGGQCAQDLSGDYDSVFGGDDRSADSDEFVASHAGSGVHEEPAPLKVFLQKGGKPGLSSMYKMRVILISAMDLTPFPAT